jgi:polyhydroxybutyrate depolymerase
MRATVPRPLVLDFHGLGEGAILHATTTQFGALAQRDGFVVAFPEGTGAPVHWDTADDSPANPDLAFVRALLARVESTQCIDLSRVYASGFSDGAFMASLLACTMSDRFTAIAAVSGLQRDSPCPASRRVPIISFHGTADPVLFFNGGTGMPSLDGILGSPNPPGQPSAGPTSPVRLNGPGYPATVRAWATSEGCRTAPTDVEVASDVVLRAYPCPEGTAVQFYVIVGGGHSWPGPRSASPLRSVAGGTSAGFNATDLIWVFFERFALQHAGGVGSALTTSPSRPVPPNR